MSLVKSSTPKRGHNLPLMAFPEEMRMEVILHLPPRHVYKLMQTNKEIYKLCTSDKYWGRVALHIVWKTGVPRVFVPQFPLYPGFTIRSYKRLMERFVRDFALGASADIRPTEPFNPSAISVSELLEWAQKQPPPEFSSPPRFIEGETPFQVAKRGVEDTENLPRAMENVLRARCAPAEVGFVTARRFARMQCGDFLHFLEDEESIRPEIKMKVRNAVHRLIGTMGAGPQTALAGAEVSCDNVRPWYFCV